MASRSGRIEAWEGRRRHGLNRALGLRPWQASAVRCGTAAAAVVGATGGLKLAVGAGGAQQLIELAGPPPRKLKRLIRIPLDGRRWTTPIRIPPIRSGAPLPPEVNMYTIDVFRFGQRPPCL